MKKTVLLSILFLVLIAFSACTKDGTGSSTESITAPTTKETVTSESKTEATDSTATVSNDLEQLFEEYSATESRESADKILDFFKSDIKTFLSTLTATEYREQVLMLLGTEIAVANKDGDTSYQDVIDSAKKMSLSAGESEALGFIIANIDADY